MAEFNKRAQKALDNIGRQTEAAMLRVLDQRQHTRFDQIQLQAEGPIAFSPPRGPGEVLTSPERRVRKIQILVARARQRRPTPFTPSPPVCRPPEGPSRPSGPRLYESKPYHDAIRKEDDITRNARNDTLQAVMKLMTKDQHAEYLAMLGNPFDLDRLRRKGPGKKGPH